MKERLEKIGFTLIETLIVLIVMAIIAGIAIPRYTGMLERQRAQECVQTLIPLMQAQQKFALENNGTYAAQNQSGQLDIPLAPTRYCNTPTVSADPNNVASIQRVGGAYTLSINDQGVITCAPAGSAECAQIGYAGAGNVGGNAGGP